MSFFILIVFLIYLSVAAQVEWVLNYPSYVCALAYVCYYICKLILLENILRVRVCVFFVENLKKIGAYLGEGNGCDALDE